MRGALRSVQTGGSELGSLWHVFGMAEKGQFQMKSALNFPSQEDGTDHARLGGSLANYRMTRVRTKVHGPSAMNNANPNRSGVSFDAFTMLVCKFEIEEVHTENWAIVRSQLPSVRSHH